MVKLVGVSLRVLDPSIVRRGRGSVVWSTSVWYLVIAGRREILLTAPGPFAGSGSSVMPYFAANSARFSRSVASPSRMQEFAENATGISPLVLLVALSV